MSSKRRDARPAILEAAWRLLERYGAAISLDQVAQSAGVSRQAVYLHFRNRNDLLVAVTDYAKERTGLTNLEAELDGARAPRELLAAFARLMAAFHPETAGASLAVEALCREDREFAAWWTARPSGRLSLARRMAERLEGSGALALPIRRAADLLWALTGPALYDQLVVRRGWNVRAYERQLGALLLAAVVRPSSSDRVLHAAEGHLFPKKGENHGSHRRRSPKSRRLASRLEPS
jgi:AcrR family transcriptional regulator